MPSFHISSSGKLVQCKNDPCKLHAGTDFQAKDLKEAQKMAEQASTSSSGESLVKSSTSYDNLPENVQTYAQNYYNKLIKLVESKAKLDKLVKKVGLVSAEVTRLNKEYEEIQADTRKAQDNLLTEMLDETSKSQYEPYYRHKDLKNVDTSNKMPESFKQAIANLNVEAQNGKIIPRKDEQLARNAAFNKFADEVRNIINTKGNENDKTPNTRKTTSSSGKSLRKKSDGINYRKYLNVSDDYRGNKDIRIGYYDDWNDPDLIYNGYEFNYYDIDSVMYDDYVSELKEDKEEGLIDSDEPTDEGFNRFVQDNAIGYLEDTIAGGYFKKGSKSWHDNYK